MAQPGYQLLQVARLQRIVDVFQDIRGLPQQLQFSRRVDDVPAMDEEIMAGFRGNVVIADLIADDAEAVVHSLGKFEFETTTIPNLKHGVTMNQSTLNQLVSINSGLSAAANMSSFENTQMKTVNNLLLGIAQRREALCVAMYTDNFTYARLGIKVTGATFGMPSDLKTTVSTGWDNAASATPISDVQLLLRLARVKYGEFYDRLDMSTAAFNYMTLTTDFQNRARYYLPAGVATASLPNLSTEEMLPVASRVLGIPNINLYDARYWYQNDDGTLTSASFLGVNQVVFSETADDNDPNVQDFANAIVTESLVSGLGPSNIIGAFAGPTRGPVAYATTTPHLNPPSITTWGVQRGFPRRYLKTASAVMTVGTFTDPIAFTDVAFT